MTRTEALDHLMTPHVNPYDRGPVGVNSPDPAERQRAARAHRRNLRRRELDQMRRDLGLKRNRDGSWE